MGNPLQKNEESEDKVKKNKAFWDRFQKRFSLLRQAMEYSKKDDVVNAVQVYNKYLKILADARDIDDHYLLSPTHFDQKKDIPELLMISQVYWDLAKAYDRNPKLYHDSEKCLHQFLKFSIGYKYQFINSEMLRKFIKKRMAYNPKAFNEAYEKLKINSKRCFVATYCFGEDHPNTVFYREFRDAIIRTKIGQCFVQLYYEYSPQLVALFERHPAIAGPLRSWIIRPFLIGLKKALNLIPRP